MSQISTGSPALLGHHYRAAGVAPEKRRIAPPMKVVKAKRCGT